MTVKAYSLYIFDLDGTLYRGDQVLPHAVETLAELRRRGSLIRYLTNNSSRTPEDQAEKLTRLGFEAAPADVLTSSVGTARYAASEGIKTAFVIGEEGLYRALADAGVISVPQPPPSKTLRLRSGQAHFEGGGFPDAVIVGINWSFNYDMVSDAMRYIRAGARFIATNADATYPLEDDRLVPGAGVVVAAVQTASGVAPYIVGKPNPHLIELILQDAGLAPQDTLVVGDRYETDILSGRAAGCDTLLVLTGVSTEAPDHQWSAQSLDVLIVN